MTESEARLPAEPVVASRQRILDVARELLAEHGFDGMSLQMVADRVGLHKSSLFHHFASKDELAGEVFADIAQRLFDIVAPTVRQPPRDIEDLLDLSDRLVDHFAADAAAARVLFRLMVGIPGFDPGSDRCDKIVEQTLIALGETLERARRARIVRRIDVRHALVNFMGLALFYPAVAHATGRAVLDADPNAATVLTARKAELRATLRGALQPVAAAPA